MPYQSSVNRDRLFQLFKQGLEPKVLALDKFAQELECEEAQERLHWLWLRVKQGPVRLLILGTSSAGKSTLINALSQGIVAPEAGHASSCVPLWVKGLKGPLDERFQYITRKTEEADGKLTPVFTELPQVSSEHPNQGNFLGDFCHPPQGEAERIHAPYSAAYVRKNAPFLNDTGVTLVDTPGISQNDSDTARADESIRLGAELVLLITKENQLLTYEKDFLKELLGGNAPRIPIDMSKRFFMVLNNDETNTLGVWNGLEELFPYQLNRKNQLFDFNVQEARFCWAYYPHAQSHPANVSTDTLLEYQERQKIEKQIYDEIHQDEEVMEPEEMENLRSAIAQAVREIMDDPELLCTPIFKEIDEIAELLAQDSLGVYQMRREFIEEQIYKKPMKDFNPGPKLTGKMKEILEAQKRVEGWKSELGKMMVDMSTTLKKIQAEGLKLADPFLNGSQVGNDVSYHKFFAFGKNGFQIGPWLNDSLRRDDWETVILTPFFENYPKLRENFQKAYIQEECWKDKDWYVSFADRNKKLRETVSMLDPILKFKPLLPNNRQKGLEQKIDRLRSRPLAKVKHFPFNTFYQTDITKDTWRAAQAIRTYLSSKRQTSTSSPTTLAGHMVMFAVWALINDSLYDGIPYPLEPDARTEMVRAYYKDYYDDCLNQYISLCEEIDNVLDFVQQGLETAEAQCASQIESARRICRDQEVEKQSRHALEDHKKIVSELNELKKIIDISQREA